MSSDRYYTIEGPATGEFRDKGSRFPAFAYPLENEAGFKNLLDKIKSNYPDASHHCYAYVINPVDPVSRSSDAGEPANTAGKPILREISAHKLLNIAIIVVRYFGGKLLGVPGLINAYGQAALAVIGNAKIIERTLEETFELEVDYRFQNEAFRFLKIHQARIIMQLQLEKLRLEFVVRKSKVHEMLASSLDFHNFTVK